MLSTDGLYFSLPLNIHVKACCLFAEHQTCTRTKIAHRSYWRAQFQTHQNASCPPRCRIELQKDNRRFPLSHSLRLRLTSDSAIKGSMELPAARVALGRAGSQRDLLQRDWQRGDISWHTHLASNPGSKMSQSHGPHVSPRSWSSSTQRSKRLCPTPQPKLSSWDTHYSQHFWLLTLHTATSASCSWKTVMVWKRLVDSINQDLKKETILWSISICFDVLKGRGGKAIFIQCICLFQNYWFLQCTFLKYFRELQLFHIGTTISPSW